MNNLDNDLILGIISFDDAVNEASLGETSFTVIGNCVIKIDSGEGQIPHFHIFGLDTKFLCCVCIYENMYFSHGKYTDTFPGNKQCKQLDKWLNKKATLYDAGDRTNWEFIRDTWEDSNPNCLFPESRKIKFQPDYTTIRKYKE